VFWITINSSSGYFYNRCIEANIKKKLSLLQDCIEISNLTVLLQENVVFRIAIKAQY